MKVEAGEPPCMSPAEDWEAGHRWMDELAPPADAAPLLPDSAGMQSLSRGTGLAWMPNITASRIQLTSKDLIITSSSP